MKEIINDLQARGILKDITNWDKLAKFTREDAIYAGFDPTASSLHLGNYVQISILKRFLNHGQKVFAVLGGATGMIGDPSFKEGERALLDQKTITKNGDAIKNQLAQYGFEIFDNIEIYQNMNILEFLREVGKNVNISAMINKDAVANRIEQGLSFTEFSYQLLQGWDFKYLYETKNVKAQLGGSDQWGNIVTGIELIRKTLGDDNLALGITANLLTDVQGNKFGKSTGGGSLWLDPQKTTPFALYQFLFNQSDIEVLKLLKWLTFLPLEEISSLYESHLEKPFLRKAQKLLAFEVVKDIHGAVEANNAQDLSQILFDKDRNVSNLKAQDISQFRGALPFLKVSSETTLKNAFINIGVAVSNRELNEFYKSQSLEVNGSKEFHLEQTLAEHIFEGSYVILKKGKKNYFIFELI